LHHDVAYQGKDLECRVDDCRIGLLLVHPHLDVAYQVEDLGGLESMFVGLMVEGCYSCIYIMMLLTKAGP
jgi:hypothetical protein